MNELQNKELNAALGASAGCVACEAACYTVAAAIVLAGAAGLAALTPESAAVVGVVEALDGLGIEVGADAALAFLKGLAPVLSLGSGAVANRICGWAGACK